jgi:hypothetical protein
MFQGAFLSPASGSDVSLDEMMMWSEIVLETSVNFNRMTQNIGLEDFIND